VRAAGSINRTMNGTGYRLLGMLTWRGLKWYLRRSYGHLVPSRRTVLLVLGAGGLGALVFAGRRIAGP
jgi:hypothetical protein